MHLSQDQYQSQLWRVHDLAHDFELIDAWQVPIDINSPKPHSFLEVCQFLININPSEASRLVSLLIKIRFALGNFLHLDGDHTWLPIPGTNGPNLRDRLTASDRAQDRTFEIQRPTNNLVTLFKPVYLFDNESLLELSNKTIYALLHVGLTANNQIWMGVYIKSRGPLSNIYMLAIRPFRHLIVYPAWFKLIEKKWQHVQ